MNGLSRTLLALVVVCAVLGGGGCSDRRADEASLGKARAAFSEGRYLEAEDLYQAYLQVRPQGRYRWEAWNRLLDVAVNVRTDPNKATGLLEAMYLEFGSDPDRAWKILSRVADTYVAQRMWDKANDALQRALNIQGLDAGLMPEIHYRLARIYAKQRENDLAQDSLELCIQNARESALKARCLYALSQTLSNMQVLELAETHLRELIALKGVDAEQRALAVFLLADICEQENRRDEARELLRSIAKTYPNPKAVEKRLEHLDGPPEQWREKGIRPPLPVTPDGRGGVGGGDEGMDELELKEGIHVGGPAADERPAAGQL
ncbi:MAG: tetratricopeptide repeat protein [Desulfovibrionaceae bacterium]|nr:tetratricopeptide repeat protein [Desulfovibrionaceae bacterium]